MVLALSSVAMDVVVVVMDEEVGVEGGLILIFFHSPLGGGFDESLFEFLWSLLFC